MGDPEIEAAFDPPEQVEKDCDDGLLAHVHEVFDLEGQKPRSPLPSMSSSASSKCPIVPPSVSVSPDCFTNLQHPGRSAAHSSVRVPRRRALQQSDRLAQRDFRSRGDTPEISGARTDSRANRPPRATSPCNIDDVSEGAKGPVGQFSAYVVRTLRQPRLRQREERVPIIKGKDLGARIPEPLGSSESEKRGLCLSPKRADHEGMAQVSYGGG